MSDNSNNNDKKLNFNKVEEPNVVYNSSSKIEDRDLELNPILTQLIEKSIKEADEGKTFTHEEALSRIRKKIQSLK